MDEMNLQIHGYATQSFIYSTNNNWDTTNSTDGSSAWTEAVVSLAAQPAPKLRIGVQARYFVLGNYGNQINLDWALADYKVNEYFGLRAGKVKTPTTLLNETQDVDPAHLWILLPQSLYPLANRSVILAHYGAVVYGSIPLGRALGKIDYRGFGGERVFGSTDGYFQGFTDAGLVLPQGATGHTAGGTLIWKTPIQGLLFGSTAISEHPSGTIVAGPMQGKFELAGLHPLSSFVEYEHKRVMIGGEYGRTPLRPTIFFPGLPPVIVTIDNRIFYVMASCKVSARLTGGLYYSSELDRQAAFTSDRYQKDWALSSRYDFNPYLYLKLEQHFIDGTASGYSTLNNADGLKPNARMTLLKLGVSF